MLILRLSEDDACSNITLYFKKKKLWWKMKSRNQTKSFSCIYSMVIRASSRLLLSSDICSLWTRKLNTHMPIRYLRTLGTFRSERQEQACQCHCAFKKLSPKLHRVSLGSGIKTLDLHGPLGITMLKTAWLDQFFAGLHPGDQYTVIS